MTIEKPPYRITDYIEKAHPLVEAKYNFSIWEMRLFGLVVANTNKKDTELKIHKLYIADIVKEFGVSKSAYPEIKKAVKKLQAATLRIPYQTEEGYERDLAYNVMSISTMPKEYGEVEDNDYIEIKLSNDIKDFVLLTKAYLKYHKKNMLYVKTPYSMRLYELLKRYEFRNERTLTLEDLREKLGIGSKYKLYGHLKKKVILPAQKHLAENSDISFSFEEKKQGKKVVALSFHITANYPTW